jgi:sodium-coupled monocarboxylate transporter 8/12
MISGKSRILWTDLVLTLILIGGLLTILVKGAVDSGGMSTVIEKAVQQNHFQQDSFSLDPTEQVRGKVKFRYSEVAMKF